MFTHEPIARFIVGRLLRVLSTINLNDDARIDACEVRDVGIDRKLAMESATKLLLAQALPKMTFGISESIPQLPCSLSRE
jgi:hypothetical protein